LTKTYKKEGGTAMKKIITASPGEARVEFEHLEDWVRMKVQGFIQDLLEEEVL